MRRFSARAIGTFILASVGLAWLGLALLQDPDLRTSVGWAVGSWFVPPDADAEWEQHPG